jgi:AAA domain
MSNFDQNQHFSNPSPDFYKYGDAIARSIGEELRARYAARQAAAAREAERQQQNGHKAQAPLPLDWDQCVKDFTPEQDSSYATERGFELQRIREHGMPGSCYVPWWKCRCIAFPIHDKDGNVYQAHCRSPQRDALGKWEWTYVPRGLTDLQGKPIPVGALVIGNVRTSGTVHLFESYGDGLAVIERLSLWQQIDAGELCVIITRGADFADRLRVLDLSGKVNIYAWQQNDKPRDDGKPTGSEIWLRNVAGSLNGEKARLVVTPKEFNSKGYIKDPNDWTRAGADVMDIEDAMHVAKVYEEPPREPQRKLRGASILDYAERPIDYSKNLLGNRWLSRCCGAFVVAPSGHGKSTWVIQATIECSCGRVSFGIKPVGALRILIIQSEDDDNDIIEMSQMCDRLKLTSAEKTLVRANTHVEWINDVAGEAFFPVLEDCLRQFPADLVVINPYTAYQGGDIRDDKTNNWFLREELNRVMQEHSCAALPIHHTQKTIFQDVDQYSWFDWMYTMAGGAALTKMRSSAVTHGDSRGKIEGTIEGD